MRWTAHAAAVFVATLAACAEEGDRNVLLPHPNAASSAPAPNVTGGPSGVVFHARIGNDLDDPMRAEGPGLVLLGGGREVDAAYAWVHATIGGTRGSAGDIVVLRAGDDDALAAQIAQLASFNSVQTIVVTERATPDDLDEVARALDLAEGVVLASDDASELLRWRGTALAIAVQQAFDRGGVIVGRGAASSVLGQFAHDASSVETADALANPYEKSIAFARDTFRFPQLEGLIVDTHFRENDRFGRLSAFMARQVADGTLASTPPRVYGIGIDEGNAVAIDRFGRLLLLQADGVPGAAYVLAGGAPQQIAPHQPLIYGDLVVARLDAPGETFDLDRACGTAFVYRVSVSGSGGATYAPANPYEAAGIAHDCP